MKNVEHSVKDNTLTITVDLTQDYGLSKSGKTKIVASTDGFVEVAPGISLGLNLIRRG